MRYASLVAIVIGTEIEPLAGVYVAVETVLGPDEATVRPSDTVCSTFTLTVLPRLSALSPLTVTAQDPEQWPATMLTWLRLGGRRRSRRCRSARVAS
ncbi:hypothetical protein GCM10027605_31240 [Micromonospora zhanjiangensis]